MKFITEFRKAYATGDKEAQRDLCARYVAFTDNRDLKEVRKQIIKEIKQGKPNARLVDHCRSDMDLVYDVGLFGPIGLVFLGAWLWHLALKYGRKPEPPSPYLSATLD